MRIVSAGIPDYDTAVPDAHLCLHTEGNSWGTRLIDYMAVECLPIVVNDGMVAIFNGLIPYDEFAIHMSKKDVPNILTRLRAVPNHTRHAMHERLRPWKRAFIWFRPEGLAYEFTIAALGERLLTHVWRNRSQWGARD